MSSTFRCTAAFLAVLARVLVGPLSEGRYPDHVGHLFEFLLMQLPITLFCAVFLTAHFLPCDLHRRRVEVDGVDHRCTHLPEW